MKENRVVLITGASSGIGKSCADLLAAKGFRVYGTSRKASIPPRENEPPFLIRMDVTDDDSVRDAVRFVLNAEGRIDILINNAGFGLAGSVEDTSISEAKQQFETNFFGVHRVLKEVLPVMRNQKNGIVINISSIAGIIALPYQPFYSASKFALEGLTEALWHELRPFGIRVVLVEPGDLKTEFTKSRTLAEAASDSPYTEQMKKTISVAEKDEIGGSSPEEVAKLIYKIVTSKKTKLRYQVGPFYEKLAVKLKKMLPESLFLKAVSKYYKIDI